MQMERKKLNNKAKNEKPVAQRSCDMVKGTYEEHGISLARYLVDIMAGGQLDSFIIELNRLCGRDNNE